MTTLIIATRNAHKVGEIQGILGAEFRCLTLREFPDAPAVIEDADTFVDNATKKAVELARWLKSQIPNPQSSILPAPAYILADDSGLEVDALHGAPGVHSARFASLDTKAEGNAPDAENNAKLLRLLRDVPEGERGARFRCVIALTPVLADQNKPTTLLFDGACEGRITFIASGAKGFGYDPLFVPDGFTESFAELGEDVKNRISHRALALAKLRAHFA